MSVPYGKFAVGWFGRFICSFALSGDTLITDIISLDFKGRRRCRNWGFRAAGKPGFFARRP